MKCPHCGGYTGVYTGRAHYSSNMPKDARLNSDCFYWRMRYCKQCSATMETYEVLPENLDPKILGKALKAKLK